MKKLLITALLVFAMGGPQARSSAGIEGATGEMVENRQIKSARSHSSSAGRIEDLWTQNRRILIDKKAELDRRTLDLSEILSGEIAEEGAAFEAFERVRPQRQRWRERSS